MKTFRISFYRPYTYGNFTTVAATLDEARELMLAHHREKRLALQVGDVKCVYFDGKKLEGFTFAYDPPTEVSLYTVNVINSVLAVSARGRLIFVVRYGTLATSPLEAARNVAREHAVNPDDVLVVAKSSGRTIVATPHFYYGIEIADKVQGVEYVARDL